MGSKLLCTHTHTHTNTQRIRAGMNTKFVFKYMFPKHATNTWLDDVWYWSLVTSQQRWKERCSSPIPAFENSVGTLPTFQPDALVFFRGMWKGPKCITGALQWNPCERWTRLLWGMLKHIRTISFNCAQVLFLGISSNGARLRFQGTLADTHTYTQLYVSCTLCNMFVIYNSSHTAISLGYKRSS